ncbi:MAG: Ig-like domain-containing protein [Armatimonadota bacterium]
MFRSVAAAIIIIACPSPVWCQTSRSGIYQIQLSATPSSVPADGQSQARLRVDIRDQSGRNVPDGTPFVAHTDLGLLSFSSVGRQASINGRTNGGFAVIFVTSSSPGSATITVQAADSRAVTYVDFLPEGELGAAQARTVEVSGGWVGYNLEMGMVEARDRARAKFGKLIIESGGVLQVDIAGMFLKAQDVVIRRGDVKLQGEDLYYDLATKRGVIRRFGEERLERVYFDSISLKPLESDFDIPEDAFQVCRKEADTWLVARSVSFFLREKIVLRNAALWIQEQKVFSFPPYWIIGLPGYSGETNSQALGMTSSGGLAFDFPFFYRVTDRATGAIKIQRGARASSVASRDGWSIAISEEYRDGAGTEGLVELGGLPRSDWGLQWRDARPVLKNGFSYLNFAMPDHRSVFTDVNVYDFRAGGRLSLRGYYDGPTDYDASYGLIGDWLMDPRPIGDHNLSYRFGTSVGWQNFAGEDSNGFTNEVYSELSLGTRTIGKRTDLQPSISNVYSWDTTGYSQNSLRGELRLNHRFSNTLNLGLDYSAEYRDGDASAPGLSQVLGLDLRASHGSKWYSYLTSTYEIDSGDTYAYWNFDYKIDRKWRWGLSGTLYDFSTSDYKDLEISLGRMFGERQIDVTYSIDTGHISLSLGGFQLR